MNLIEYIPAYMSAIAAIAASVAAFYSLKVSRRSIDLAESTALANHHQSATLKYYEVVQTISEATEDLKEVCFHLYNDWACEIERFDHRREGGKNPRPLRHVFSNASEMLVEHSSRSHRLSDGIFSIVVSGMGQLSDTEYQKLLKKADSKYCDFETVFDTPSKDTSIVSAKAFRWSYYQMIKRVKSEDWEAIWEHAWSEEGWATKYRKEYSKVESVLKESRKTLQSEETKLKHTPLPLDKNVILHKKYCETITMLERLEECSSERLEQYQDYQFVDEYCLLVLCSMATARVTREQLSQTSLLLNH